MDIQRACRKSRGCPNRIPGSPGVGACHQPVGGAFPKIEPGRRDIKRARQSSRVVDAGGCSSRLKPWSASGCGAGPWRGSSTRLGQCGAGPLGGRSPSAEQPGKMPALAPGQTWRRGWCLESRAVVKAPYAQAPPPQAAALVSCCYVFPGARTRGLARGRGSSGSADTEVLAILPIARPRFSSAWARPLSRLARVTMLEKSIPR